MVLRLAVVAAVAALMLLFGVPARADVAGTHSTATIGLDQQG